MKLTDELLRKLKEHEDNEASLAEQKLKEEFMQIAKGLLVQVWPEEEVDLNLEYYVTGEGEEIDSRQPDNLTPEQQEKLDEILKAMASLHELYKQCRAQWSTCYLFLNAPYETPKTKRNLGEDKQANTRQNQNMYNIMHPSKAEKERNPEAEVVVTTQQELMHHIRQAFSQVALKTRRFTIVFTGEGYGGDEFKKGSLCLMDDAPMPMEEFVKHILSIWEDIIIAEAEAFTQQEVTNEQRPSTTMVEPMDVSDSGESTEQPTDIMSKLDYTKILDTIPPFPASVTIIFGQCFSCFHKLDKTTLSDWGSRFDIIAPTDAEIREGKTVCSYTFDAPIRRSGIVRRLIKSHHFELEEVARKYQEAARIYPNRLF